jgi:ATPase subunit of ABC transporter with duplicated ATPase domains
MGKIDRDRMDRDAAQRRHAEEQRKQQEEFKRRQDEQLRKDREQAEESRRRSEQLQRDLRARADREREQQRRQKTSNVALLPQECLVIEIILPAMEIPEVVHLLCLTLETGKGGDSLYSFTTYPI